MDIQSFPQTPARADVGIHLINGIDICSGVLLRSEVCSNRLIGKMPHHLKCDVVSSLTWAPAFCPAALVGTAAGNLDEPTCWQEASELLYFLPFLLFRFPNHKGAGLLAIVASSFTNPPKATTPKESLGIPNNSDNNTNSTTTATQSHLAVKNRFARSFSQLVASQLVPGDLITMAKSQGILTNMGVDYVVVFRFATTGRCIIW